MRRSRGEKRREPGKRNGGGTKTSAATYRIGKPIEPFILLPLLFPSLESTGSLPSICTYRSWSIPRYRRPGISIWLSSKRFFFPASISLLSSRLQLAFFVFFFFVCLFASYVTIYTHKPASSSVSLVSLASTKGPASTTPANHG